MKMTTMKMRVCLAQTNWKWGIKTALTVIGAGLLIAAMPLLTLATAVLVGSTAIYFLLKLIKTIRSLEDDPEFKTSCETDSKEDGSQ